MTAKEFLYQGFSLDRLIQNDMLEIERLRGLAESIPSTLIIGSNVQSSVPNDRVCNTVMKIVDLSNQVDDDINEYIELKRIIRKTIKRVQNLELRLILHRRYVNLEKWEKIAVDLGYSYQWVIKLHGRGLVEFEEKNKHFLVEYDKK